MKYWKYIIIGLLVGMMAFHIAALFYIRHQRYELTSPDYYAREMKHQLKVDALSRGQHLQWNLIINPAGKASFLEVTGKDGSMVHLGKLDLEFYRPHNSRQDQTFRLIPDKDGRYYFDSISLSPGRWDWIAKGSLEGEAVAFQKRMSLP